MHRQPIDQAWTLQALVECPVPQQVPATVPGCVHTDLLAADLIVDPYLDRNELDLVWIGRTPWRYQTNFTASPATPGEHAELVFAGVDTVAAISLNGQLLGEVENMHRSHRFDVTNLIGETNTLTVDFAAQVDAAQARSAILGGRVHANHHPYNAVRKMACNFGWDWGPDVTTAGLWQPVTVERWHGTRLAQVRPLVTEITGNTGRLAAHVTVAGDQPATLTLRCNGIQQVEQVGPGEHTINLTVPGVERWWPRGYGAQPLYPLQVTLTDSAGELDRWEQEIGFRTVTVEHTPDEHGTGFRLLVNDSPVWVKGVNWIPDDAFLARACTPQRYAEALQHALDAEVNLIRVWGGGIYETAHFYEFCDRTGLLVWQDFLFACAAYSEDEPLRSEVIAEAREAVARLSAHPSLVVWNGNNENTWGYHEWGWEPDLAGRSWGAGYYDDILPGIVAELDPTRPYLDASPSSFGKAVPNDAAHGTKHIWDVWNERDYTYYAAYNPRFVSEFGYQAPPTWATLTDALHDDPLTPDSPGMQTHQKANDGNQKLIAGAEPHLRIPNVGDEAGMRDWLWAMQLQQARAIRYGIEHFRGLHPICTGAILWQLNDCWPVTSWAAVDGGGRRKPLWFALSQAYAPVLVSFTKDGAAVSLHNDTGETRSGTLQLSRRSLDGTVLANDIVVYQVPAREAIRVELIAELTMPADPDKEFLVAVDEHETPASPAFWYFAADPQLHLIADAATVIANRVGTQVHLQVQAHGLVKDATVLVDQADSDARVDGGLVTILPGQAHTFVIESDRPATAFVPLLRTANELNRAGA